MSAGHVAADRNGPDGKLVPGQKVAGEAQEQRQDEQNNADAPVELPGRLITSGQKDPVHVQPDGDDHGMGAPAVQFAKHAERRHIAQGEDVVVSVLQRRPVIEHEEHAGDCFHQEEKERNAAHAPGVAQGNAALAHRHGMQVQENIGQHHHDAVATVARRGVAEDAFPNLRIPDEITNRHAK